MKPVDHFYSAIDCADPINLANFYSSITGLKIDVTTENTDSNIVWVELKDKDISDEVANVALDRFEEVGLINDQALASNYVSSQHERKGLGKNALRQQLRAKGVSDDVALEAISQISDDQEFQAAFALACKKIRSLQKDDAKTQLRKIVGVLARKGYSSNLAFRVAKEVITDLPDGLPLEI